jgi:hypothetical protein
VIEDVGVRDEGHTANTVYIHIRCVSTVPSEIWKLTSFPTQLHAVETTRPSTPSTILHWALVMTMNVLVTWMGLKTHSALW